MAVGFREVLKWNVSQPLRSAAVDRQVAQLASGWKILEPGLKAIEDHYKPEAAIIRETRHSLRSHLALVKDSHRRTFLDEAIKSFDVGAYRAAIVLSWVGAAHILQEHVVDHHKPAFNSAGTARESKAKASGGNFRFTPIRSLKEFVVIGEADLLQLCQDAGILDKAEKQELQARLDLRNRCGHPNAITVAEHIVASHIESLLLNVYSKY